MNCAALSESLLESELFGHVKGAFTGAIREREGRFEAAHGGDIFLDEIGDLPLSTQVKLLRVLEEKVVERVGDNRPIQVDVRIISATNRNLPQLIENGSFREDFFYRINVIPIWIPPLRERVEDIPLLSDSFFRRIQMNSGKPIQTISKAALDVLMRYTWPGNVRELRSCFEYAVVSCSGPQIEPEHLPAQLLRSQPAAVVPATAAVSLDELKKQRLVKALRETGGNQSEAARQLGISRTSVWSQMKRFHLDDKAGSPKITLALILLKLLGQRSLALSTSVPLYPNPLGPRPGLSRTPGPGFFPGMVFGFFVGRYDLKRRLQSLKAKIISFCTILRNEGDRFSHVEVAHHIKQKFVHRHPRHAVIRVRLRGPFRTRVPQTRDRAAHVPDGVPDDGDLEAAQGLPTRGRQGPVAGAGHQFRDHSRSPCCSSDDFSSRTNPTWRSACSWRGWCPPAA